MRNEKWLPILGLEEWYEVSDYGQIRSLDRTVETVSQNGRKSVRRYTGRLIIQNANKSGHMTVCLPPINGKKRKNNHNTRTYVHRLVLEAFVGIAPAGMVCCHKDGDPANNHIDNLEWGSRSRNLSDFWKHRAGTELAEARAQIEELRNRLALCVCGCRSKSSIS